jgi:GrpB-like predicted nucleotidyltransferase (UPF0157 family)
MEPHHDRLDRTWRHAAHVLRIHRLLKRCRGREECFCARVERGPPVTAPLIVILPYQARWPEEFRTAAAALRAALGGMAARIDHIGSTAVPGLAAKDIIDIQVTIAASEPDEPVVAALIAAGYQPTGIREDHRPPGDDRPPEEWRKRFAREPEGSRRLNIHIRTDGRANQRYALLFRDFLRASAFATGAYERTKRALAALHPNDMDAYYAVKDPICDLIMAAAEPWAAAIAWAPGPSDA